MEVTYVDHGGAEVVQVYPGREFSEGALRYRGIVKGRILRVTRLHDGA